MMSETWTAHLAEPCNHKAGRMGIELTSRNLILLAVNKDRADAHAIRKTLLYEHLLLTLGPDERLRLGLVKMKQIHQEAVAIEEGFAIQR